MENFSKSPIFFFSKILKVIFSDSTLHPKKIRILYVLLFLFFFIKSLNILSYSESQNILFHIKSKSDFEDYYNAAYTLRNRNNPYYIEKIHNLLELLNQYKWEVLKDQKKLNEILKNTKGIGTYLYPPFFAFVLIPFTFFPYNIAAILYQIIQIALLGISFYLLFQIGKYMESSRTRIHKAILIGIFSYLPLQLQNIEHGNVGFILIFLLSLSFYLYFKNIYFTKFKIIRDIGNGIILGIATTIKVIPGFIGGIYFINKKFFILTGMILGILIGIFFPSVYLGWELNWKLFYAWYDFIIQSYQKYSAIRPYANNQTISGAICKLFIPFSDIKQFEVGLPLQWLSLSLTQVSILIKSINLFLWLHVIIISIIAFFKKMYDYQFLLYYLYLILLIALLTSGISWYHTYGILFLVIFFYTLMPKSTSIKKYLFVIPPIYIWIFSFVPNTMKNFLSLYSIFTWLMLIILLHLILLLYQKIRNTTFQDF